MYDVKDSRGVPVSGGIPPIVRIAATIGVVMILMILGACIFGSAYHHVWPSINSTHIKLD
jgi:hypothetical protein